MNEQQGPFMYAELDAPVLPSGLWPSALEFHQIGQLLSELINWFADCNRRLGLTPKPRTGW